MASIGPLCHNLICDQRKTMIGNLAVINHEQKINETRPQEKQLTPIERN